MSERPIQRISILGVGLIGGSLGLSWKKYRPSLSVMGYDRPDILERALARGAIDETADQPEEAVTQADLVVVSVRLSAMPALLELIAPHLPDGCVVTDVGSVKRPIVRHAEAVLPEGVTFVGGHPMAGSEQGGIEHADSFLFENATYVLCPPAAGGDDRLRSDHPEFLELIVATGAHVLMLDPDRHDRIAAAVSHLPQLLSVALVDYVALLHEEDEAFLRLAAGGFRDMTRIASSPYAIWRDILIANEGRVLDATAGFAATFQRLRNRMIEESLEDIEALFDRARSVRERIPRDTKGFLHPLADIYVFAEDRPGVLHAITRVLLDVHLNIKDVELLKVREGTGGAFRLGFNDGAEADAAVEALSTGGFTAYRL